MYLPTQIVKSVRFRFCYKNFEAHTLCTGMVAKEACFQTLLLTQNLKPQSAILSNLLLVKTFVLNVICILPGTMGSPRGEAGGTCSCLLCPLCALNDIFGIEQLCQKTSFMYGSVRGGTTIIFIQSKRGLEFSVLGHSHRGEDRGHTCNTKNT